MRKLILLVMVLGACTEKKVSFDTVEEARRQVRDNVTLVAQAFRAENQLQDYNLYIRGDSTQSGECPQGDGWASVDLLNPKGGEGVKLKCSTVSLSLSCMVESDFKGKRFASEEGHCNNEIPFPLPKLVK